MEKKLCIIGSGYMAEALIKGILEKELIKCNNIFVVNPIDIEKVTYLKNLYGIVPAEKEDLKNADIILLAFKPQDLLEAMKTYKKYLKKDQLLISILAGVSTTSLEKLLDFPIAVIRTMPNLALGVGESATAYCLGSYANEEHAEIVKKIFMTVGSIVEVEEKNMDAVTGLSGSGPAYIFYLLENMIKGALKEGLKETEAKKLAIQTLLGAAKLIQEREENPEDIRKKITSAKGTTEAALKKLDEKNFPEIIQAAVSAATDRSRELGKNF